MNTIRNKKGFTVIELVIVIAVIAILAAVLIPTFVSLVQKANMSVDLQLVRNLNIALATDKAEHGRHNTLHDVIHDLEDYGFLVTNLKTSEENTLLWDSVNDAFCLYNSTDSSYSYLPEDVKTEDVTTTPYKYFAIYDKMPEEQTFSIYWNGDNALADDVTLTVGFDAGHTQSNVTYSGDKDVIVRMFGGKLTVSSGNVTVYGFVGGISGNNITAGKGVVFHKDISADGIESSENGSFGDNHLFGEDGNELNCLVAGCTETNPNHTCQVGEIVARMGETAKQEESNKWYADVKCSICGTVMYTVEIGERTSETGGNTGTECEHEWSEEKVTNPDCTHEGVKFKACLKCGAIEKVSTTAALGHLWNTYDSDSACHWKKCARAGCDAKGNEHAHNFVTTGSEGNYTVECKDCQLKYSDDSFPKTFALVIKLNKILAGGTHRNMHEALLAAAGVTNDEENTQKTKVKELIEEIEKAENDALGHSHIIVWDQTIDRFVVVRKNNTNDDKVWVVYTPSERGGLSGKLLKHSYSNECYPLWATYTTLPEKKDRWASIYFAGDTLEGNDLLYNSIDGLNGYSMNSQLNTFNCGFDMGFVSINLFNGSNDKANVPAIIIKIAVKSNSSAPVICRTAGTGCDITLIDEGSNDRIINHFGQINDLVYQTGRHNITYYEYGTLRIITVENSGNYDGKLTIYAMPGSTVQDITDLPAHVTIDRSNMPN